MGAGHRATTALHLKLTFAHMRMGWGVGAERCRKPCCVPCPRLPLRYAAQDAARAAPRAMVGKQPQVAGARCCTTALPGSPGHALGKL